MFRFTPVLLSTLIVVASASAVAQTSPPTGSGDPNPTVNGQKASTPTDSKREQAAAAQRTPPKDGASKEEMADMAKHPAVTKTPAETTAPASGAAAGKTTPPPK